MQQAHTSWYGQFSALPQKFEAKETTPKKPKPKTKPTRNKTKNPHENNNQIKPQNKKNQTQNAIQTKHIFWLYQHSHNKRNVFLDTEG